MDRVKEALFNILAGDVVDSHWWDLFAGTGAIGIEALSRGAAFVRFTDLNLAPIKTLRWNVEQCGFNARSEIRRGNAFNLLALQADHRFEYIYIAPPQYKGMWLRALRLLDHNHGWLIAESWIIAQLDPKEYQLLALKHLIEFDQRRYGSTLLVFYKANPNQA
jgi:16S rRNA (guanine966-N2)-methyltransferase